MMMFADVRLPAIIGDHMVLQQKSQVRLWGWSDPGEMVRVKAGWKNDWDSVRASGNGRWEVTLWTPVAGGPYNLLFKGNNEIQLKDVLIGEVWVLGGQSNMEWANGWIKQGLEEAPNATNGSIRFFHIPKTTSDFPQDDVKARWVVCNPEDMKKFSAIGYFFAKQLHGATGFPMGMISSNWGGTPAETWTPSDIIMTDSALKAAALKRPPNAGWSTEPAKCYNAMIWPISKFRIAGTLWYQGESNVGAPHLYKALFTGMIGAWRRAWGYDFPFYYVQIAPFAGYGDNNVNGALLRESQSQSLSTPRTGMVVIHDLVDNVKDIHPVNKKDVATRLGNMALDQVYGKPSGPYRSPSFKNMEIEGDKIRVRFNNAENGLISKGGEPTGFYIAGDDEKFVPATAKIEGNQVVVSGKSVKNPKHVRFGFTNTDMPNLFSKEGIPVDIFRF